MIPVYPWPFHPEYYRRREIVEDRLRRLKALGKPVRPDSDAPTACHSLAGAIRSDPFEAEHLSVSQIGALVIDDNLPEDTPPMIRAPQDFSPAIDAKTLTAHVPNNYAARYDLFNPGPAGHFSPSGKFVKIVNTGDTAGTIIGPDPYSGAYWSYRPYGVRDPATNSIVGEIYAIESGSQYVSNPVVERSIFNSWIALRADGTMAGGGVTDVTGSGINPAIRANYYIAESSVNIPGFMEGVANQYSGRPLVVGFPHDPTDAGTIVGFAYSTARPTGGSGWIDVDSSYRIGLERFQFISASNTRSPSSIIDGVAILIGGNYALTEDGTLYRYDGQSLSVRATGVYMFGGGRIYFDNGTEEDL